MFGIFTSNIFEFKYFLNFLIIEKYSISKVNLPGLKPKGINVVFLNWVRSREKFSNFSEIGHAHFTKVIISTFHILHLMMMMMMMADDDC